MTEERIKSMIDTKIKVDFSKLTNDQIVNEFNIRIDKYEEILKNMMDDKSIKFKYMSFYVGFAKARRDDMKEVSRLETKLKIGRMKILELVDLKNKING